MATGGDVSIESIQLAWNDFCSYALPYQSTNGISNRSLSKQAVINAAC